MKKRPLRSIINVPASAGLKDEMDIYALKGGHTRVAKGGEVVANKAAYLRALHAANVGQIGPVDEASPGTAPCGVCGHPLGSHDPEDGACDHHADVGLGVCQCGRGNAAEVVTFESMTPGEQWWALYEVYIDADPSDRIEAEAFKKWHEAPLPDTRKDMPMSQSDPGYQARYDAALAYVKGVMDGE